MVFATPDCHVLKDMLIGGCLSNIGIFSEIPNLGWKNE
ncbi:hypothetical protein QF000_006358 [Paraburkholderia atlantica]|uniref:Uncharacterized protein n=1 Tax=Paraburkholderia atlantica TaxID=2654982 RepID=A0A7W8V7Q3_PARAM|nr:hypothetical protein [Paraburkholderia atlantica]